MEIRNFKTFARQTDAMVGELGARARWFRRSLVAMREAADNEGFECLIYCLYRSPVEQAKFYRRGRPYSTILRKANSLRKTWGREDLGDILINVGPQYGRRVTNAAPGQSMHQYWLAADGVPTLGQGGRLVWDDPDLWKTYGDIAVRCGLEWSGNWKRFREKPHIQTPAVSWKDMIAEADGGWEGIG